MSKYELGENISPDSQDKVLQVTDALLIQEIKRKREFLESSLSKFEGSIYGKKSEIKKEIKETTVSYFLDEHIIKRPISLFYNEIKVQWKHITFKSNIDTDNTTILLYQLFNSIVIPDTIIAETIAIQFGIKYSNQRFYIVKKNDFIFLTWKIKFTTNTHRIEAIYKK